MVNYYKVESAKGRSHDEIMEVVWGKCRDNSRTPMQWDSSKGAGFTTSNETWLKLNPNYTKVNVAEQLNDSDSILNFYKKLIRVRKGNPLFVYGTFELLLANHPRLFVYTRKLGSKKAIVINNFSSKATRFKVPGSVTYSSSELVLNNYDAAELKLRKEFTLKPYETRVYLLK
jgi:alpha-glucosidase